MNKEEKRIVPQLRFPEFEKDKEWNRKSIDSLVKDNIIYPQKDGNHGNIHPKSSDFVPKGIPFIMASDIRNGEIDYYNCKHISKEQADNLQKGFAKENDVLLTHKGTVGEVAIIRENEFPYLMLTPQVTYYRIKNKSKLSNEFLRSFFLCGDFQKILLDTSGGGTRAYVGITAQGKLNITLPPTLLEQQKIANCLSSLDNVITGETKKLDLLKDHKKGLLQQLFPVEGETQPKLRFPEFENDGDWRLKPFSKIFKIGSGRDYKHLDKGEIPVYGTGGYMLSVNEFLYNGKSACIGRKGTINKPRFLSGKFWTVDTLFYTHSFKGCSPEFVYLLFQNINWLNYNEAGGVPSLSKDIIRKIEVYLPKPKEQQKIANCLSSVDDLIETQTKKIEKYKDHKKGLLQQLFPTINELTI